MARRRRGGGSPGDPRQGDLPFRAGAGEAGRPRGGHRRIPNEVYFELVEQGEPYSRVSAWHSLDLDRFLGNHLSVRAYARLWHRSETFVRNMIAYYERYAESEQQARAERAEGAHESPAAAGASGAREAPGAQPASAERAAGERFLDPTRTEPERGDLEGVATAPWAGPLSRLTGSELAALSASDLEQLAWEPVRRAFAVYGRGPLDWTEKRQARVRARLREQPARLRGVIVLLEAIHGYWWLHRPGGPSKDPWRYFRPETVFKADMAGYVDQFREALAEREDPPPWLDLVRRRASRNVPGLPPGAETPGAQLDRWDAILAAERGDDGAER